VGRTKHGDNCVSNRHLLYGVWATMRSRCANPNFKHYKNYGGRGIRVCSEWKEYIVFRTWALDAGYYYGAELDRINVDGHYSPLNCRWVPRLTNRNKRNNHYITAWGETKELAAWAEDPRCKVSYVALKKRIYRGVSSECALTDPLIPPGKYERKKK